MMGIEVVIEDEAGAIVDSVEDPTNLLHKLLPSPEEVTCGLLRYVDWYGDTIFNRRQIAEIIDELEKLSIGLESDEEKHLVRRIVELAQRGKRDPHLYLRFRGD